MTGGSGATSEPAWLPGLDGSAGLDGSEKRHAGATAAGATFTAPILDRVEATRVAEQVRAAALAARASHETADVVDAVATAAARLADPGDPIGKVACTAVQRASGCQGAAAEELLREHAKGWTKGALTDLIVDELGDAAILDKAQPDEGLAGRLRRAVGPPLAHLVLAGNVPGVAVTAVIRCLLVRSGVLCKLPSSEPWLVGLFARALHEEDPALAATLAATWWPTSDIPHSAAEVWTKRAGKVIIYGGDEAVLALRAMTPPSTPLVEYGPRIGIVLLGPGTTDAQLAGLAADTFAYEQAGCVSPRLVYLLSEHGSGEPAAASEKSRALIERLGSALSTRAAGDGRAPLTEAEAVAIRVARSALQFGAEEGEVRGPAELAWTMLYRRGAGTYSEPLPRVLWVYDLGGIEELGALRGVLEGRIQAMGLAGLEARVERHAEELAVELGVSRVTRPGRMAWPPPDWRHDGRMQLLPLVRWTDFET